ncbi:leucine-rich repeat transmembrane protein FLRT3-like [Apostichopus japonicus]|uniref:leucine-rich repeat transmembrane protein FLRT3-like n=1 Tax=Stichopus japonicus TaxID=307972 RepID=UPI003AB4B0D4
MIVSYHLEIYQFFNLARRNDNMETVNIQLALLILASSVQGEPCPQTCRCSYGSIFCDGDRDNITTIFPINQSYSWPSSLFVSDTDIPSLQSGQIVLPFMPNLFSLNLPHNQIWAVNESLIGNNSHISYLSLTYNNLTRIPTELLLVLEDLESVYLDWNQIVSVPPFAFHMNMKPLSLSLTYNKIHTTTPDSFRGLEQLRELQLFGNILSDFPLDERIHGSLTNLTSLHLHENVMSNIILTVNESCFSSSLLRVISFRFNRLNRLEKNAFCAFRNLNSLLFGSEPHHLEVLTLRNNSLSEIPTQLLLHLPDMRLLSLRANKITYVPKNAFVSNDRLATVSLSHHWIVSLDISSLQGLNSLDLLDLQGNNLTRLPEGLFDPVGDFGIDLRDNPWFCDCKIIFLKTWILRSQYFRHEMLCDNPIEYRGIDVNALPFIPCVATTSRPTVVMDTSVALVTWSLANDAHYNNGSPGPCCMYCYVPILFGQN